MEAFEFPDGQLQMGWRGREVDGVGSRPGSSSLSHCAPGWRGEEPNLFSKEMQLWFQGVHISHLWLVFPRVLRGEYRVSPCHQDRFAVTLATSSAAHWLPLLLLPAWLPKAPCRKETASVGPRSCCPHQKTPFWQPWIRKATWTKVGWAGA